MKSSSPASLDTLKMSVPPSVKVAEATANFDDLESPAVASHPLRVNYYFSCSSAPGERFGRFSQRGGYSGNRNERKESERFNPDNSGVACFGSRKTTRESPAHRRASCALPLRFRWRGGFRSFAGFRRCAACGCWTTGKIFIRGCEDIVLDE